MCNSHHHSPEDHAAHEAVMKMRHSCAHIMAAAVQQIWPDAKFGVGPALENGFYYDMDLPVNLTEDDLAKIETVMRKLRKKKSRFDRREVPIDEAISYMQEHKQPYKVELLELLKTKGSTRIAKETGDDAVAAEGADSVSFYQVGEFVDLCRGPHVDSSGDIGKFKLHAVSGAYWRGDAQNPQLQRVYGLCYETQEELDAEIERLEQVKLRDHRRLGKQLGIFTTNAEIGAGLPLWLPNGTVLRDELEYLAREEENHDGYKRVKTPIITKEDLY